MVKKIRILAFAGSARDDSYNRKLLKIAVQGARDAGADVTVIDLKEFRLPLYDQEEEESHGLPKSVLELKKLMCNVDGFLIASPEHNSSISAALKNLIDWTSRQETEKEPPLVCFKDKVAVIMSASPGGLGGLRGLVHLRAILGNMGVLVLPSQQSISAAHKAFDDQGNLLDKKKQADVIDLGKRLVEIASKL